MAKRAEKHRATCYEYETRTEEQRVTTSRAANTNAPPIFRRTIRRPSPVDPRRSPREHVLPPPCYAQRKHVPIGRGTVALCYSAAMPTRATTNEEGAKRHACAQHAQHRDISRRRVLPFDIERSILQREELPRHSASNHIDRREAMAARATGRHTTPPRVPKSADARREKERRTPREAPSAQRRLNAPPVITVPSATSPASPRHAPHPAPRTLPVVAQIFSYCTTRTLITFCCPFTVHIYDEE
jgi:hypothetical protein